MKTRILLMVSVLLATPILALSTLTAYGEDNSSSNTGSSSSGNTSDSTTSGSKDSTGTGSSTDTSELKKRLAEHAAEFKVTLTTLEKTKIQTKCKAGQGIVQSLDGRIKGIQTSRSEVYKELVLHLTDLETKLKTKGLDTTTFNNEITELQKRVTTFNTDLTTYQQAVSDLGSMDCATDPSSFKSALLAARADKEQVTKDALAIRTYVNDTIKATLKDLRSQIEDKDKTSDSTNETEKSSTNTTTTSGGTQ